MVTDSLVEHEVLKAKLSKEFDRLKITDETVRTALTIELNRLSSFLIESYSQNNAS